MTDEERDREDAEKAPGDLSRRDFVALSSAVVVGALAPRALGNELTVIETNVEFRTPDGTCDAAFFHPKAGSHPGVLIWPDSLGLRPAFRELGKRIAGEGYSVLVPNHLYRSAQAPVFDESFSIHDPADREGYFRLVEPFLAPGAAERDAVAYVVFLDAQPHVNKNSFHGGNLARTNPTARICSRPRSRLASILRSHPTTTSASQR